MFLDAPAFPVSFSLEEAKETVSSLIKSKYWENFAVGELKLVYLPYTIFSYTAFEEIEGKETQKKTTRQVSSGKIAFSELSGEFDEALPKLHYSSTGKILSHEPTAEHLFDVKKQKYSLSEVEGIVKVKLASDFSVAKDNVIVSALEKVYLPVWIVPAQIGEENYHLEINAVTGEIIGEIGIPHREKGWLEVTAETIDELKNPSSWFEYAGQVSGSVLPGEGSLIEKLASDRPTQVLVLTIIAAFILLWIAFYA